MILLGSTGSIGINTLKVASKFGIQIEALVAGNNYKLLNQQIKKHNPKFVAVANKNIKDKISFNKKIFVGEDGILEILKEAKSNLVLNGLVGFLGLRSSHLAISLGKKLALANKESLVVAGKFLDISNIIAVDSEHFSLQYLLKNNDKKINKLFICASGGAFRDINANKLGSVSIKDALNHPNWSMGDKITIDSATMTNKLFELLEARWLFKTRKIDAFIEPKSIMHALVSFNDGTSTAHLSKPDMRVPIAYAIFDGLSSNEISKAKKDKLKKHKDNMKILKPLNMCKIKKIEFKKIKTNKYPIWEIKKEFLNNDNLGVVLNASNEIAVDKFLQSKISFLDISKINILCINKFSHIKLKNINDVFLINKEVREFAQKIKI